MDVEIPIPSMDDWADQGVEPDNIPLPSPSYHTKYNEGTGTTIITPEVINTTFTSPRLHLEIPQVHLHIHNTPVDLYPS